MRVYEWIIEYLSGLTENIGNVDWYGSGWHWRYVLLQYGNHGDSLLSDVLSSRSDSRYMNGVFV